MKLRDYQLECIDAVWEELYKGESALVQAPTGSGKTLTFSHLIKKSLEQYASMRTIILMGRVDLVLQTEAAIARVVERRHIGAYCGSLNRREINRPVTVASIHSVVDIDTPIYNMIIIDETHNLDQDSGSYIKFIEKQRARNPKLKIVGFTATPFRSDGVIYGEEKIFKRLCYKKTIQDMIALGYLCRPILKQAENAYDTSNLRIRAGEYMAEDIDALVSDEAVMRSQVREALDKMKGRKAVAWATANIDHCERLLKILQEEEGENAFAGGIVAAIHSKQTRDVRGNNLSRFTSGGARHMVFVSILSEGFDYPPIDCIVLMRPTRSPVLYVQTVGRGLRIYPGKDDCLVLDYGQVVRELGPLDDPKVKGKKGEGEAVLKLCPQCSSWVAGGFRQCPDCSFEFPPPATPEDKLTKRADNNAEILSKANEPETEEVGPVYISMHQAKSGNACVKIVYSYGGMKTPWGERDGITEFFVTTSAWAMQRLEQRLGIVGDELPSIPFPGERRANGTFKVVKVKDGKFWRVLSVIKIAQENPCAVDDDPVEPSFDFGANVEEVSWT